MQTPDTSMPAATLDPEQAVDDALLTAQEQTEIATSDPTHAQGIREVGRHMLGLIESEHATNNQQLGARIVLMSGTPSERKALFLHDMIQPLPSSRSQSKDGEPLLHELDSVQALLEVGGAPESLKQIAEASAQKEETDTAELDAAVADVWRSVINNLPLSECAALLRVARKQYHVLPLGTASDPEFLGTLWQKMSASPDNYHKVLATSIIANEFWRLKMDHLDNDSFENTMARNHSMEQLEKLEQEAVNSLPTHIQHAIREYDNEPASKSRIDSMLNIAEAGSTVDSYAALMSLGSEIARDYNPTLLSDEDNSHLDHALKAVNEGGAAERVIRHVAQRSTYDRSALRSIITADKIMQTPAFEPIARDGDAVKVLLTTIASYGHTRPAEVMLADLKELADRIDIVAVTKLFSPVELGALAQKLHTNEDPELFSQLDTVLSNPQFLESWIKQDFAFQSNGLHYATELFSGKENSPRREAVVQYASIDGSDELFANRILEPKLRTWIGAHLADIDKDPGAGLAEMQHVVDLLQSTDAAQSIEKIDEFNPQILREISLFEVVSGSAQETATILRDIANLPPGIVDNMTIARMRDPKLSFEILASMKNYDMTKVSEFQPFADALLRTGRLLDIREEWTKEVVFTGKQLQKVEATYMQLDDAEAFQKYMERVIAVPIEERPIVAAAAIEIIGGDVSQNFTKFIKDVMDGRISLQDRETLGITKDGEEGLAQLKKAMANFVSDVRKVELSDGVLAKMRESLVYREAFKSMTRFEVAEFGSNADSELSNLISYYQTVKEAGRVKAMPKEYMDSGIVQIERLRPRDKSEDPWTPDVIERYDILVQDLQRASNVLRDDTGRQNPRPLSSLLETLKTEIQSEIDQLSEENVLARAAQNGRQLNDKALTHIARQRNTLRSLITPLDPNDETSIPLRSLKSFEQNFQILARHDGLHSTMRTIFFAAAMRQDPQAHSLVRHLTPPGVPPEERDMSNVREFVEHIVNQETFSKYFTNKKAAERFRQLTSSNAIEQALVRREKSAIASKTSKGTLPFQFVPTRSFMMEVSGHIADACWASKYPSIAESMPNMTTVIMKQYPDDPEQEKFIGSGMLIETNDEAGNPVLLIRGLNPRNDTVMHEVEPGDFYDKFVAYAGDIATARKRRLAIVIDDHSGGSGTNRPTLFAHMREQAKQLPRLRVNPADTTFNKYNVSNDAYALSEA